MKRSTDKMNREEFLAYLFRRQTKEDLFSGGLALVAAGIVAYAIGLSTPASLIAGAAGMIAILAAGYLHLTEPEFVSTAPSPRPDPDYDPAADREEYEEYMRSIGYSDEEINRSQWH